MAVSVGGPQRGRTPAGDSAEPLATRELRQIGLELRADVVAIEGELDRRAQVVELVPHVEPALERQRVHGLLLGEQVDRVGELDLAAVPGRGLSERVEDLRGE